MALKAGKHILVEKTFAMKSSDAHNVIKLKNYREEAFIQKSIGVFFI